MKKILKIVAIIFLALFVFLLLVPVLFKNKIVTKAKTEINNSVNARVEFADVSLSVFKGFPDLAFQLDQLSVVGIEQFEGDTLLALDKLYAELGLMSVLFGDEMKLKSIILDNPLIYTKIGPDSTANWDIVAASETTETEEPENEESSFNMALQRFEIINGRVVYTDVPYDMELRIEGLNALMTGDLGETITTLNIIATVDALSFDYEGIGYLNRAKLDWQANMEANLDAFRFTFNKNRAVLNAIPLAFDGSLEMPEDDIITDIDFEAEDTDFKNLLSLIPAVYATDFEALDGSGSFAFHGFVKGTYNDSIMPAFAINLLTNGNRFAYPDLPESVENIAIDLFVEAPEGTYDEMTINLRKLHFEMANNPVDMALLAKMTANDTYLDGKIDGVLDLASIHDIIALDDTQMAGIITAALSFAGNLSDIENENYDLFKAEGGITINDLMYEATGTPKMLINKSEMDFSPQYANLKSFEAKVGESDFNLSGHIDNILSYVFEDEILTANFTLVSNLLNANQFLAEEDTLPEEAPADTVPLTAFEVPRNLDITFASTIQQLYYDNLDIQNVNGKIIVRDGQLILDELRMALLGGTMKANGSYDSRNIARPVVDVRFGITGFDIPEMFRTFNTVEKLAPLAQHCTGNISASIQMQGAVNQDLSPDLNTISMAGSLSSGNIAVVDAPVFNLMSERLKSERFKNPALRDVNLEFTMENGTLEVEPFDLKMGGQTATVHGKQHLDKTMEYAVNTTFEATKAATLINNFTADNTMGNEVDVEVVIGGTLDKPEITAVRSTTVSQAIEDVVEETIEEGVENIQDEAEEILAEAREKARKLVEDAENEADRIERQAREAADKILDEAENEGQRLIDEANGPVAKRLAEKAAEELMEKARQRADEKINNARQRAQQHINDAQKEADDIIKEAEKQTEAM